VEKPVAGEVVVIPFPQTDLAVGKRRPALVLVSLEGDDLILCQVTSKAKSDAYAIPLDANDFSTGSLRQSSYVRPNRLFTVHKSVVLYSVGVIALQKLRSILDAAALLFQGDEFNHGPHA